MEISGMLMQVGSTQNIISWACLFWVASTHPFGLTSGFNYRTLHRPNISCCSHCTTKWKMFASTRRQATHYGICVESRSVFTWSW